LVACIGAVLPSSFLTGSYKGLMWDYFLANHSRLERR